MADNVAESEAGVGFLYKTMLERDPKKRRVKPVQKHLLQIDFAGLSDSEDDSDFEVTRDASDVDSDDTDEDVENSDDDDDESDDEDTKDSDDDTIDGMEKEEGEVSLSDMLERVKSRQTDSVTPSLDSSYQQKKMKMLICCVCLGDHNEEDDEIVECDNCGVLVHEGCYGISESQSVASTESSASTEPWFCDACKAGVDKPNCELCPNVGGIFKETDAGRWVHIVCALYVPGVAFGDVDKLSPVTLFEMSYSKWGAKECYLCEDERFSKTGVCVSCDAGMCRNHFHVTCAQREGLLSEANPDEDIADPFYAYCRVHADKFVVRVKKRNWLAIQSFNKQRNESSASCGKDEVRVQRKLSRHRRKFQEAKSMRDPPWTPPEKWPRFVNSCASAVRRLIRKAELVGINTQLHHHSVDKGEMRKKGFVNPAMSVDFVAYFLERNSKVTTMKSHLKDLLVQNETLQQQEKILRSKYDQLSQDVNSLSDSNHKLVQSAEQMWKILGDLAGKKLPVADVLKPKKAPKSQIKKSTKPKSPPAIIHQCGLCKKTNDQHQLAKCDMCRLFYHLGCLDPPLVRMPKKTKLQGWQCSECAKHSSAEEEDNGLDPNAPRRLRDKITLPRKFIHQVQIQGRAKKSRPSHRARARKKREASKRKREQMIEKSDDDEDDEHVEAMVEPTEEMEDEPVLKKEKTIYTYSRSKSSNASRKAMDTTLDSCTTCGIEGSKSNMVRCDECKKCYHFHCLDPPLKKTPKRKGYDWHCEECDTAEQSDQNEDEPENDSHQTSDEKMDDSALGKEPGEITSQCISDDSD